jgi:hypothetical protein
MPKMTPEEKEARRLEREAAKEAEEQKAHEEFLLKRERFRNEAPHVALQLLARAERLPFVHKKITTGVQPYKDAGPQNYFLVQFWTGDSDLETELYIWEGAALSVFDLNCREWELESAVRAFEEYEGKVLEEEIKAKKRRELIQRLTEEERKLLGV